MQLKNLLLLASAAMGAIAQYDDGFYNEVQYDNFEDEFATSPKAIIYRQRHCQGPPLVAINDNRCRNLSPHMPGNPHSIRFISSHCKFYAHQNCQAELTVVQPTCLDIPHRAKSMKCF